MYTELKQMILQRLGETKDLTDYCSGFGELRMMNRYPVSDPILKIERKIVGIFRCEFSYVDENYIYNPCSSVRKNRYARFYKNEDRYEGTGGEQRTAILLSDVYEFSEEHLVADVMMAAAFKELIKKVEERGYYDTFRKSLCYKIVTEIAKEAKKR